MPKNGYISSLFAAFVAGSCAQGVNAGPESGALDSRNIPSLSVKDYEAVAETPRHYIPYEDHWLAVGRLVKKDEMVCTATLIERDVIITADHCTEGANLKTLDPDEFKFYIGYTRDSQGNVNSLAQSSIIAIDAPETSRNAEIFDKDPTFSSMDIAYMKLDRPLGEVYGFFSLSDKKLPTLKNYNFYEGIQAGYATVYGPTLTGDLSCGFNHHILSRQKIVLNCTVSGGDSGSPLLHVSDSANPSLPELKIYGIISTTRQGVRGNDSGEATPVMRALTPEF